MIVKEETSAREIAALFRRTSEAEASATLYYIGTTPFQDWYSEIAGEVREEVFGEIASCSYSFSRLGNEYYVRYY